MGNSETSGDAPALLRLSPGDNVLVAARSLPAGIQVEIGGQRKTLETAVGLGHKIAAVPIPAGEKIVKCHAPIGSATCNIAPGQHVHLHNMKSDYLPTYVRSDIEAAGK